MNVITRSFAATLLAIAATSAHAAAPHVDAAARAIVQGDYVTTAEGVRLYYKDWGPKDGPVVTFSHGWPLNSDSWEAQMLFLAERGYRVVAHDRRGHGRSSQPWDGNDMDHYADDLAAVIDALDLHDVTVVGFSTGGGEVARYIGRHGTARVKKAVLVAAVPPIMVRTADNPRGLPMDVFDGLRKVSLENRSKLYLDIASGPFFGFNRPGAKPDAGLVQSFWAQGMQAGHKNTYDCIKAFSETDLREDLRKMTIPTLVIHGDDDQIVPLETCGKVAAEILPDAQLKVYAGGSHGICTTHKQQINQDLLNFIQS